MSKMDAEAPQRGELPRAVLNRYFGYSEFRPRQMEAIEAALTGRDSVVVLPTGAGKSVCYQVPAMCLRLLGRGPTVVVSPLIALMQDQVEGLRARGIEAAAIHSQQSDGENRAVREAWLSGALDLLYVSPERAVLKGFRRDLSDVRPALIAVDEAHCISQWGHDFRPEYMLLDVVRGEAEIPLMALTATATPRVVDDMERTLRVEDGVRVLGSFTRPNLHFRVFPLATDASRMESLMESLVAQGFRGSVGSGRALIYCATRKKVESVADELSRQGVAVGYYHAGRSDKARGAAHRAFDTGRHRVLVATNAFGMGIDYPDVRLIVHFQTPGSVEAYYQEAGRAGRDGERAECHLYFGVSDLVTQRFLSQRNGGSGAVARRREEALGAMEEFARSEGCRQEFFTTYFGGEGGSQCERCDSCEDGEGVASRFSAFEARSRRGGAKEEVQPLTGEEKEIVLRAAGALTRPVGKVNLAKALRGSRAKTLRRGGLLKLREHGELVHHREVSVVAAIEELLAAGRLENRGKKYPTIWLAGRPVREKRTLGTTPPKRSGSGLERALENYRRKQARSLKWKPYMVFHRKVIRGICANAPRNLGELERIEGLGPAKVERFGEELLLLIRRYETG